MYMTSYDVIKLGIGIGARQHARCTASGTRQLRFLCMRAEGVQGVARSSRLWVGQGG
jgi:hypothetical protein